MISSVWKRIARHELWERIFGSLFLVTTGAYLTVWYLARSPQPEGFGLIQDIVQTVWLALLTAWCFIVPRRREAIKEPSPAAIGTAVVLSCGLAAAFFLAQGAAWPEGLIVPGLIVAATLASAVIVHRFASTHAKDIGEARFYTSGSGPRTD